MFITLQNIIANGGSKAVTVAVSHVIGVVDQGSKRSVTLKHWYEFVSSTESLAPLPYMVIDVEDTMRSINKKLRAR